MLCWLCTAQNKCLITVCSCMCCGLCGSSIVSGSLDGPHRGAACMAFTLTFHADGLQEVVVGWQLLSIICTYCVLVSGKDQLSKCMSR